MLKYTPYIVAALVIALAVWIMARHIIRLVKGKSTCGSCSDTQVSCSSSCAGCSYASKCGTAVPGNNQRQTDDNKQDTKE